MAKRHEDGRLPLDRNSPLEPEPDFEEEETDETIDMDPEEIEKFQRDYSRRRALQYRQHKHVTTKCIYPWETVEDFTSRASDADESIGWIDDEHD